MEKFRTRINFEKFDIVTYAHSKGVTKPGHKGVADWREIMRYFVFERFEETRKVFEQGYCLYGCLLTRNLIDGKEIPHERLGVSHWYRGTFVSVNLNKLRNEFLKKEIHKSYLGVEAFFGSLCNFEHCFNAYDVPFSLYLNEYPETLYKDPQAKYFDLL